MSKFKVSRNFSLYELVSQNVLNKYGSKSIWFIDPKVIAILQFLRDRFGKVMVNNWYWGGTNRFSCYRPPKCVVGAFYSQHKFGRAADPKFYHVKPLEVREDIRRNFEKLYKPLGLTTIEQGTDTWLHFDVRPTGEKTLYEVPFFTKEKSRTNTKKQAA